MGEYSEKARELLEENGISEFDRVEIFDGQSIIHGYVLPKSAGDPDVLIIKLENGYNIGIHVSSIKRIRKEEGRLEIRKSSHSLEFDENKPGVGMVVTGGTISSKLDYRTGGVYALEDPAELLEMVPEIREICRISEISSPFMKMSEDMELSDYPIIAREVYRLLKKNEGVIVTHGTDTLHFTAAALSFMVRGGAVALVGSQRSTDRPSTDAWLNLICAARAVTHDIGEVGIVMHGSTEDDFCYFLRGTKVRKMHTSRRDAFRPINSKPLLKIWKDRIEEVAEFRRKGEVELDDKISEKVAMVEVYPSSDPDILEWHISRGMKGIIIKATALGHVPTFSSKSWIEPIRRAVRDGVFIGIASQTLYGSTHPSVYTNLRILGRTGATFLGDMLPETAYVKLAWVLGHTEDFDEIREMMLTNYAGEISLREEMDEFLW